MPNIFENDSELDDGVVLL